MWLGFYEPSKMRLVANMLKPGDVFADVGAHAGMYSLMASRIVGSRGVVIAIEPNPSNVKHLSRHLELNGADNVIAIEAAASDQPGVARFRSGPDNLMGTVSRDGEAQIRLMRLDDLPQRPGILKIDVEGDEAIVLAGAIRILAETRPIVFLATHGEDREVECRALLGRHGYTLERLGRGEWLARPPLLADELGEVMMPSKNSGKRRDDPIY
jgi:FkbM family methyltransferase